MCSFENLTDITRKIALLSKDVFAEKLNAVILYGSYARGDATTESDIDIMVLCDVQTKDLSLYKKPFIELTSELGMLYDVVITVTLKDTETFNRYLSAVPFYESVNKEGVKIAV